MTQKSPKEYIYQLDTNHRINFVNDAWLEFASENGAPDLRREHVLNKSIWDFMADRETRHLFDIVFKRLRAGATGVRLPFRCDSPDCRRFMTMEILARPDGEIHFKSWITREEVRPAVRLLDFSLEHSSEILRMCSWCKKIHIAGEEWLEVEDAIVSLDLFDASPLPQFTHTICTHCAERVLSEIGALEK